jgi:hypothetical protein
MTERKLQLIKNKNGRIKQVRTAKINGLNGQKRKGKQANGLTLSPPPELMLTPAEAAEAARFRALTAARAARQAMLHRIMAEIAELDETSPAA